MVGESTRIRLAGYFMMMFLCLPTWGRSEEVGGTPKVEPAPFEAGHPSELSSNSRLSDPWGRITPLSEVWESEYLVVLIVGTECPLARLYATRFVDIARQFNNRPCNFVMVDANVQDSLADLQRFIAANDLEVPVLKDLDQHFSDCLKAVRTPEAFILNPRGQVLYRGRVDDQYQVGIVRPQITREDLKVALNEILAGERVRTQNTPAQGCFIGRRPADNIRVDSIEADRNATYATEIAPILNRHCVRCHREGDIGPMSFVDYDEVTGWGETILEVIEDGRMPPWHASNPSGTFQNEQKMAPSEIETLRHWVDLGMPSGDLTKTPEIPIFADRWRLETPPDEILTMSTQSFKVPAHGVIDYKYYVVDPGWTEDRWIRATQVLPGNPRVVHHAIVFLRTPETQRFDGLGWLGGYVPGQTPSMLETHQARRVPAGSKLVFQMHYTPTGRSEEDQTQIGIWFADESKVKEEVLTGILLNQNFEIPPNTAEYRVEAALSGFPEGSRLLSLTPHMHVRGQSIRIWANDRSEDAGDSSVLDVPKYDFNWQHNYEFVKPIPLGSDSRISFEAKFNNSSSNPVNPDPNVFVRWGDQTWQEMAVVFVNFSTPRGSNFEWRPGSNQMGMSASLEKAQQCMERFDHDGDGFIQRREAPEAFAAFAFGKYDRNNDNRLSLEELWSQ